MSAYECSKCGFCAPRPESDSEFEAESDFPGEPNEVFYNHTENSSTMGATFEEFPATWHCPQCGAGKECFKLSGEQKSDS